ncbi:MAG: M56 family metallopeptidase [Lawsonibacter sp.]|nr:M56 family metallopeptidase [Lawsonibacter sp.]
MNNIWGFLLQTLSLSRTAVLLLAVKWLLADKLSPRWQYGVWSILALRALIPAGTARSLLPALPLWLETWKGMAERGLNSTYSAVYQPIHLDHVFPVLSGRPASLTDWLLVLYAAGVVLSLAWYLLSYLRLRLLLARGTPAGPELQEQLARVGERYGLKPCRAVQVRGLPSAFVCGVVRPVLAVPDGEAVDDKVLLHELLHLNHLDALQSLGWAFLRSLHWCNPFLWYAFDRVGNDMESLCDQRVLERLEGEERREYGKILLSMANDRYPRSPGTTSLSNGGKNIARRIAAIVRFKKYPRGMALVSVCAVVVLASPALWGTAAAYGFSDFSPGPIKELDRAMAMARINRCTTLAGALDTYAKGLIEANGVYIAAASPLSRHQELEAEMRYSVESEGWVAYHLDRGPWLDGMDKNGGYTIYDITPAGDGRFHAWLEFPVSYFLAESGKGGVKDENGETLRGSVLVPVYIWQEDGWVVEEAGERICSYRGYGQTQYYGDAIPWLRELTAQTQWGTVTIQNRTVYTVDNQTQTDSFFGWTSFNLTPRVDAQFKEALTWVHYSYSCLENTVDHQPQTSIGIMVAELDDPDQEVEFPQEYLGGYGGGSSSDGFSWDSLLIGGGDQNYEVAGGSGDYAHDLENNPAPLHPAYRVRLFWDGEMVEELTLTEEDAL